MIYIVWHGTCPSDVYIAFASADEERAKAYKANQPEDRQWEFEITELPLEQDLQT